MNRPPEPRASIVIPAFNECASIKHVVGGFAAIADDCEIIVVDDGSTDGTGEILDGISGLRVIHHSENLGYGASLMTGIREARAEIIVTFDADGQHDHNDVLRLLDEIGECAMVVGARTAGSSFDVRRTVGRTILSALANFWTGCKIPDVNSGLRAFRRREALRYASILPSGFSFTTTLTLVTLKEKHPVRFVPIVTRERVGRSTFRRLGHGLIVLRGVLRLMALFHFSGRLTRRPCVSQAGPALLPGGSPGPVDQSVSHAQVVSSNDTK
jgi:glycosyltransferase involved in cell wall biosynthesis